MNYSQNNTKSILKKASRKYKQNLWNVYKTINETIQTLRQKFRDCFFGRFRENIRTIINLPEGGGFAGGCGVAPEGGYVLVHGVKLSFIDTQLTVRHLLFIPGGCPQLSCTQKLKEC